MAAESLEFQQTLEAFSDEQQTSCTELFSKLQDLAEVTLDFKEIQKCLDAIHPSQLENEDQCLLFITAYLNTRGVFPKLEVLKVQNLALLSHLEDLPLLDCIKLLPALTELDLTNCSLSTEMQDDFQLWSLVELRTLVLNKTGLTRLPPSVGRLHHLKRLSLANNKLTDLPITLEFCEQLEELDVSHNQFTAIPGVVLTLRNLKVLRRLGSNLISRWTTGLTTFPHISVHVKDLTRDTDIPEPLQSLAACTVMGCHANYWRSDALSSLQCKLVDALGSKYRYCHNCHQSVDVRTGYTKETKVDVLLPVFADLRDVPFQLYSCTQCLMCIRDDLTERQTKLRKWMEDDHKARMRVAMEKEGVVDKEYKPPRINEAGGKKCVVM